MINIIINYDYIIESDYRIMIIDLGNSINHTFVLMDSGKSYGFEVLEKINQGSRHRPLGYRI